MYSAGGTYKMIKDSLVLPQKAKHRTIYYQELHTGTQITVHQCFLKLYSQLPEHVNTTQVPTKR
jgi:hypothetical protein